ncbi:DUF4111 domain-containing protein [Acetatifactor muris]|uniref:Streptomycin 3''-adenylyltransferase n=1 Tax=Acetatifactor muris TaxID=879566 RepID=A0A2K4ZM84_9FIRM|nr:aminoglycoside adenylyltransferase domain-containing protein [Acetatifactor muris]MCR2049693.1 DUF4111 domain-containing protein [Acetatifactor muris]SOY31502.1 Streptomycin 3''-adenylyltransferase [Acetatifactor muris]
MRTIYKKKTGMDYEDLLCRFTEMCRRVLGENLTGVYLHGSAAMGCFQQEISDLDLLVIVNADVPDSVKADFMEHVVRLDEEGPGKGMELSLVKREFCRPFVYPTPFELHFSEAHLEWYKRNPQEYVEKMRGTDRDLAAHFMITRRYGICLWGAGIEDVFGEVPAEAYRDSILYDMENAREDILINPLYVTLNLCRVLGYLREGLVLSKKSGGEWGLEHLPEAFHVLLQKALQCYASGEKISADTEKTVQFADYMTTEIHKMVTVQTGH